MLSFMEIQQEVCFWTKCVASYSEETTNQEKKYTIDLKMGQSGLQYNLLCGARDPCHLGVNTEAHATLPRNY